MQRPVQDIHACTRKCAIIQRLPRLKRSRNLQLFHAGPDYRFDLPSTYRDHNTQYTTESATNTIYHSCIINSVQCTTHLYK